MYNSYIIIEKNIPNHFVLDRISPELALYSTIFGLNGDEIYTSELDSLPVRISEVLETLTDFDKEVLLYRFGFRGKFYTANETARQLGVSSQWILQIEEKALRKLRHPSRARRLKTYFRNRNDFFATEYYFDYKEEIINDIEKYLSHKKEDAVFLNSIFFQKNIIMNYVGNNDTNYSIYLDELNLSNRTYNALRSDGMYTLGELLEKSEKDLMQIDNFGQKCLNEIQDKLIQLENSTGFHYSLSLPNQISIEISINGLKKIYSFKKETVQRKYSYVYDVNSQRNILTHKTTDFRNIAESIFEILNSFHITDGLIFTCNMSLTLIRLLLFKGYFFIDNIFENREKIILELLENGYITYSQELKDYCEKYKKILSGTIKYWKVAPPEVYKLINKFSKLETPHLYLDTTEMPTNEQYLANIFKTPPTSINLTISDTLKNTNMYNDSFKES